MGQLTTTLQLREKIGSHYILVDSKEGEKDEVFGTTSCYLSVV
jgi:hypothetical protein